MVVNGTNSRRFNVPTGKHAGHRRGAAHPRWSGGHDPEKRRANAKASAQRYPEKRRARERVKDAVRRGDLAPIKTCSCVDCGAPAQRYDHHEGYEKPLSVQPVCFRCDGLRSKSRGEHRGKRQRVGKKEAGRLLDGVVWDQFPAGWAQSAKETV